MKEQMMNMDIIHKTEHGHRYVVKEIWCEHELPVIYTDIKLPPLLKKLREDTDYTYKVPHGNKVRTIILEEGICRIAVPDSGTIYEITIERW